MLLPGLYLHNFRLITYKSPVTDKEFLDYYSFRWQMLRQPLNLPRGSEQDDIEMQSFHIAAYEGKTIIGVGRIHIEPDHSARIRYMAVRGDYQNQGVGSRILQNLEKIADTENLKTCWLNAREGAINFYLKNGYVIKGQSNSELAVRHVRMEKTLD